MLARGGRKEQVLELRLRSFGGRRNEVRRRLRRHYGRNRMTVTALIVAAGKGERLGGGVPKQFRLLGGKPVLRWAVESLIGHPAVQHVSLVIGKGQQELAKAALAGLDVGPLIEGGAERADSVRAGLGEIKGDAVLVHEIVLRDCALRRGSIAATDIRALKSVDPERRRDNRGNSRVTGRKNTPAPSGSSTMWIAKR